MWEVRQNGIRYCHCGSLRDATNLVSMAPGRTIHLIVPPIGPETVDVSAEDLGRELALRPQLILEPDERQPLDLEQ